MSQKRTRAPISFSPIGSQTSARSCPLASISVAGGLAKPDRTGLCPRMTVSDVVDTQSPAQRSVRMSRVRSRDTKPELRVRRKVHCLGYRYRVHRRDQPGRPDIVFGPRRKVILVHGCFWHGHEDPACKLARSPKSRLEFWGPKLARNRERDSEVLRRLSESDWQVLTLWECQLGDDVRLERRVRDFLG